MAASVDHAPVQHGSTLLQSSLDEHEDPFIGSENTTSQQPYVHRYSSRFDLDNASPAAVSSPSQVKRILEAHLLETERRLQDTQKLGTSLLDQQAQLQDKLREVEQQSDETKISPELREQLESISKEHEETSKEIARSLLAPKSRVISGEDEQDAESGTYSSQATGSPTKISAPSRRQRNQPTNRAGDLQFAADISTSLLAQVRQLQAAVAERDEAIKTAHSDRLKLESDVQGFTQRLRDLQEHEQRYKDENWNLETQNHELLATTRDAGDREKKLGASLAAILAEKSRLQTQMEEAKLAHNQLNEEHLAARKAHETELHSLKKDVDTADTDRSVMQARIDELTAQNQEFARAMASRFRFSDSQELPDMETDGVDLDKELDTPEHSPPPSPIKATPRHGGLESETLRSSLHHAHRMIQNLKGNIHREKTEKIELKRMLQDARDELEQRRSDNGPGSGNKRQKTRPDVFKKPMRPDQLGGSRRARTDVELDNEGWEDHTVDSPSEKAARATMGTRGLTGLTDMSDAYQTANETEGAFETADERQNTESEAFETGAESLAGDSTDDLTETEETLPRAQRGSTVRSARTASLAFKQAGSRGSYLSTASTSADEDDEQLQTPVQPQPHKFKLKNGRSSYARPPHMPYENTPDSVRSSMTARDSPATVTDGRSPPAAEQSLFAELGDFDDGSSERFDTPARSSVVTENSTPSHIHTPAKARRADVPADVAQRFTMVDSAMMTEPWQPTPMATHSEPRSSIPGLLAASSIGDAAGPRAPSPSDFPLPPTLPNSPVRQIDSSTQYTPQRTLQESPLRNNTFITPPKTVWDEASEAGSPMRNVSTPGRPQTPKAPMTYSGMLTQTTAPFSPPTPIVTPATPLAYSGILIQQTQPISPEPVSIYDEVTTKPDRYKTAGDIAIGAAAGGILATAASSSGLFSSKDKQATTNAGENSRQPISSAYSSPQEPMRNDFSRVSSDPRASTLDSINEHVPTAYAQNDQAAQTMLTAQQIEEAMKHKAVSSNTPLTTLTPASSSKALPLVPAVATRPHEPQSAISQYGTKSQNDLTGPTTPLPPIPNLPPSRPASASSHRTSSISTQQHPPLPTNYKRNIAKANSIISLKSPENTTAGPSTATIMGPPLMPASAMRRPQTPAESMRSPTRENATPRASQSSRNQHRPTTSQMSRRSSVSSFASELDERFNIRANDPANVHGYEGGPSTDPRMIQAITQTMIGEYLWKYTRKSIGKDFSSTRHRRYFWVHPYTKTLYWSTHGPETGRSKESSTKGAIIESVRVITDENPMPPGLHRKSLEVTTPGRKIRFTAPTGQRHETWFNALSYLLLRGEPGERQGTYTAGGHEITREDVHEFNAGGYDAHLTPAHGRHSMSSYNSRTTRGTSTHRSSRHAMPSHVMSTTSSRAEPQPSSMHTSSIPPITNASRLSRAEEPSLVDNDSTVRARSGSRMSKIFGSVTGRPSNGNLSEKRPESAQQAHNHHNRHESDNSIYDASIVSGEGRDSAEEMRRDMLRQEAMGLGDNSGGLENVRACCDGKHDVSTLTHNHQHRHSDRQRTLGSVSDRINRSMSRRG